MRSIQHIGVLFVVTILISLMPALNVEAQGAACFGLAAADCKIIATADANIGKMTSFKQDFDLAINYAASENKGTITAKGSGLFALDPTVSATDTPAILNALKMTLNMTGALKITSGTSNVTQNGSMNMVVVDGMLYTQTTNSKGVMGSWQSQDLAQLAEQQNSTTTTNTPSSEAATQFMQDPAVLQALASIPNIKGFITLKKSASSPTLDGQKQIEFVYTFNVKTLLTAKEMYPVIRALEKVGGVDASNVSDQALGNTGRILANALKNTTFKVTRWIGAKDGLYHAFVMDGALNLNMAALGQQDSTPTTGTVHFGVRFTQVGTTVNITAPQ